MTAPRLEKDQVEFQEKRITELLKERAPGRKYDSGREPE
jgi:hypothetical protein